MKYCSRIAVIAIAACFGLLGPNDACAQISLTQAGYSQDFDSLANTGLTNTAYPAGFSVTRGADTNYAADNGSSAAADIFSYGTTGSTERALGIRSLGGFINANFQNNTGETIQFLKVTYRGEQWRRHGVLNSSGTVQFSVDGNAYSVLDFTSPVLGTGTNGALDGNASPNFVPITATIDLGVNAIASGSFFDVGWSSGANHGLAIDDFAIAAVPEPSTYAMIGLGVLAGGWVVRRQRQNQKNAPTDAELVPES